MIKHNEILWRPCANGNCQRPAAPGEPHCETCALESSLYRRAERIASPDAGEVFAPARVPRVG